jgi:thiamine biosynthesis lipoprotein
MTAATTAPVRRVVQLMGMPISLALRGRHAGTPEGDAAWAAAVAELRWVDEVFSTWREDSFVSRFARHEVELADCPPELAEVIAIGLAAERESHGAFSVMRGGRFDPTGVVKGWAVERAAAHLRVLDDTDVCLNAGGDLTCTTRPGAEPWRVGIEHPLDPLRLVARVPVREGGVATSGTAHRGAHLVDARTGEAPSAVASVTVVAPSLTQADVDATAAYALGPAAAAWLRTRPGRVGLVVWRDGDVEVIG